MKVIIDPEDDIQYMSFYIKGLIDRFGRSHVVYNRRAFNELSDDDRATRTMNHYYTLTGPADDTAQFVGNHAQLHEALLTDLKNRTEMKIYMDEDFNFGFIYRSQKDKQLVLFRDTLKPGEYK